jgi:tRNA-Thr(GGU) m(6)t(6)A37 methyltransferase TsaA
MSLIDWLKARSPTSKAAVSREPVTYRPIGIVRNQVSASRTTGWEDVRSDILLRDDLAAALDDIEGFSHVIVVFHFDRVPDAERRLSLPVGDGNNASNRGVLATRSQLRPNAIGVSVVPVLHRRKGVLRVRGLDALNGTPVLDLKPYLPPYDSIPDAKLPAWATDSGSK